MKHGIRILPLVLLAVFLCSAAAAEELPSRLYAFTEIGQAPDALREALTAALGADAQILSGYATLRCGQWRYGQAVIRDAAGWALCGLDYLDGAWQITMSRRALRQDEAPRLVPEAVQYGYGAAEIDGSDGCGQFDIVYPDVAYTWFAGSDGWRLARIATAAERISVSERILRREDSSDVAYNTLPVTLAEFDISVFPRAWAELKALSEASEYADSAQGQTFSEAEYPCIALLREPVFRAGGNAFDYYLYSNVAVTVSEERNGYVHVSAGTLEGWIEREQVLIGTERAAGYGWMDGHPAQAYGYGTQREQPVYAQADRDSAILAQVPVNAYIHLVAVSAEAEHAWFAVRLADGTQGFMPCETVCDTDNMRDAWIYSEDPARRLHLRAGPGRGFDSLGKYYSGVEAVMQPPLPNSTKGWARVIIHGAVGYVDTDFLDFSSDYSGREWLPPLGTVQGVNDKGLNLRAAPNTAGDILARCPRGEKVEILGVIDSLWAHVRLRDGQIGYMMLRYLGGEPEKAARNSFSPQSASAEQYEGTWSGELTFEAAGLLPRGIRLLIAQRPADNGEPFLFARDVRDWEHSLWISADDFDFWQ